MIVKMQKYDIVLYHQEFHDFIQQLQSLGVVDVTLNERDTTPEQSAYITKIEALKGIEASLKNIKNPIQPSTKSIEINTLIDDFQRLRKSIEEHESTIKKLEKEVNEISVWGNFDSEIVGKLQQQNIAIKLYTLPTKSFESYKAEQPFLVEEINRDETFVYFVIVNNGEAIESFAGLEEVKFPTRSYASVQTLLEQEHQAVSDLQAKITSMAGYLPQVSQAINQFTNELHLCNVITTANREVEDKIIYVNGFAPVQHVENVNAFLDSRQVLYFNSSAVQEDNPPILLKNNYFSRLFEPITKLFMLPQYGELDLTPFFAPFFMLFYGFCFGDAGYGLLFVIGAGLAKLKVDKSFKPILTLVQLFGAATVVFGAITGTFFGISLANVEVLVNFKDKFVNYQSMFNVALIIGVIQILFGMFVKVINISIQKGFKYAVSTLGWFILLISAPCYFLFTKEMPDTLLYYLNIGIMGIAALAIVFYNSPDKNPFMNFATSIWDTYNMSTGLMGDVLSYIRLFGLGLSGGILGAVFNNLAFGFAPDIPVVKHIVIIVILVIGHSLNIFMSALGSLVHPMRLTFVEFFKNAGFEGGGREYNPLKRI